MQRLLKTVTLFGGAWLLSLTGNSLFAQQVAAAACSEGEIAKGSIGYSGLECNCDFTYFKEDEGEGQFRYYFRAEPVILGVKANGPAEGKLRAGDVITSIDGYLITTREGGRRFANPEVGRPVTLGVRRDGREIEVQVIPEWECQRVDFGRATRAPLARPAPPAPPAEPRAAVRVAPAPRPARAAVEAPVVVHVVAETLQVARAIAVAPQRRTALPKGELGFGISCKECKVGVQGDSGAPVWEFSNNPELTGVEPGKPAYRAGMRSGDILTHINGRAITSEEGGRLFGAIQPGDTVTFRFARNNTSQEAELVAEERGWIRAVLVEPAVVPRAAAVVAPPPQPAEIPDVTRFTGVVGDAHIVVTGGPITVSQTDDEVIIVSGDIRVRITRK